METGLIGSVRDPWLREGGRETKDRVRFDGLTNDGSKRISAERKCTLSLRNGKAKSKGELRLRRSGAKPAGTTREFSSSTWRRMKARPDKGGHQGSRSSAVMRRRAMCQSNDGAATERRNGFPTADEAACNGAGQGGCPSMVSLRKERESSRVDGGCGGGSIPGQGKDKGGERTRRPG
ncbi:unnamed protein product [Gadus morhua 'NCC']